MAATDIANKMKYSIGVCLLALLASTIDCLTVFRSPSGPFQSRKAPAETIHNYTLVQPLIFKRVYGKENIHPVSFTLRVKDIAVHLFMNKELFPPHFTSKHFNEQGDAITSKGHVNCFYQGWVEGHPEWRATMSTCAGLRGSFGDASLPDQFYHIEPLDAGHKQLEAPHVLYLESEFPVKEFTCGTSHSDGFDEISEPETLPMNMDRNRLKRQNSLDELIVEWAVFNDNRQFQQYGTVDATVERALAITNYVDMLYRNEYRIRIVLTYVETWNSGDRIAVDSDPVRLLDSFETYEITAHMDSAMLITGIDLNGNTVGLANVRGMCSSINSFGLTQDSGRSLEGTGATAAHELGHIFNMRHDDSPRSTPCNCNDPSGRCIMASVSGFPAPTAFSTCSREYLNEGFDQYNLDRCLFNEPAAILGMPVCGNGLREQGEVCDCGTPESCTDPCCNATSCQLVNGATCFSGSCCDNCQLRPYGTPCRNSMHECDIMEYCSGDSSDCPEDFGLQNGQSCNNNQSYCFSGICLSYDSQCQALFSTNKGIDQCYARNVNGDRFGNCGHDPSQNQYLSCEPEDVMCGVLFCEEGSFTNMNNIMVDLIITVGAIDENNMLQNCVGTAVEASSDSVNPGLVEDGTRCGDEMVCRLRRCVPLSTLNIPPCPMGSNGLTCSGNGVCNNDNICSCIIGFRGPACGIVRAVPESGGDGSGGAIAGGIIGALLAIALLIGVVAAIIIVYVKRDKPSGYTPSNRASTNLTVASVSVKQNGRSAVPSTARQPQLSHPTPGPSRPYPHTAPNPAYASTKTARPRTPPPRYTAPPPPPRHTAPPPRPTAPPQTDPTPRKQTNRPPPPSARPPPKPVPASKTPTRPQPPNKPALLAKPVVPTKPGTRKPLVPPKP